MQTSNNPLVLVLSETQSMFRAVAMNALTEHPFIARYIDTSSYIQKLIALTALRYCGSIVGIYTFKLLARLLENKPYPDDNTPKPSMSAAKPIQLYTSILCFVLVLMMLMMFS